MKQTVTFKNASSIPALGFGTWELQDYVAEKAVAHALQVGYRHIDTADIYHNHHEVGSALKGSGLRREEYFVTTKLWRDSLMPEAVVPAVERFLEELQCEYIDLLLIHWPNKEIPVDQTLRAMTQLQEPGLVRNLGVSNFSIPNLKHALQSGVEFVTNQVEFHPSLNQTTLLKFCQENNIKITAYSPIAQGDDLSLPVIQQLAKEYDVSPAQVCINWLLRKGMIAIPRSSNPRHIEDNFKALDWSLSDADVARIDREANSDNRTVNPGFAEF